MRGRDVRAVKPARCHNLYTVKLCLPSRLILLICHIIIFFFLFKLDRTNSGCYDIHCVKCIALHYDICGALFQADLGEDKNPAYG